MPRSINKIKVYFYCFQLIVLSSILIVNISESINNIESYHKKYDIKLRKLRSKVYSNTDGRATERCIEEIIEFCLRIVPDAKLIRTHCLHQSTKLLTKVFKLFPQLEIDLSIFTYHFPKVCFVDQISNDVKIKRINFNWEDDFEFWNKNFDWDSSNLFAKINILNFHPIHIFLNSNSYDKYNALMNDIDKKPLHLFDKKVLNKFRNSGVGANNYLTSIISSGHKQIKLREIK